MKGAGLILRNLLRNKRRTLLTVLSIAVSLFLITFLMTILTALRSSTETDTSHLRLITRHKVSLTNFLPESYWLKIRRQPGVLVVCPASWFGGIYVDERNFFAQFAVDPRSLLALYQGEKKFQVDPEQAQDWVNDRQGALVERRLAEKYGWKLGDRITLRGTIYSLNAELNIRAIARTGDDQVFFHYDYLNESIGRRGIVGTYWIKVARSDDLAPVAKKIDAAFANSDAETLTETEQAFQAGFISMLGNVQGLVVNLSLVIAFTMLMVAANTMSMTIRERTVEIAVLRSLGFGPGPLLGLLLGEATVLAVAGGVIGIGACAGLLHLWFTVLEYRIPQVWFTLVPPPGLLAALLAGTIGLGVASGIVPSLAAVRRPIVDGLRQA